MRIVQTILRLIIGLGSIALVGCAASTPSTPNLGAPAPNIALNTLDGGNVSLTDYRGQVVIANFWASWCPPCVAETPRLVEWYTQHSNDGLMVLGIDTLYQDSRDDVVAFTRDNKVPYPILVDEVGDVSRQWLARNLPRSYVIDREGVVRFVKLGELTQADFDAQIAPLLSQ